KPIDSIPLKLLAEIFVIHKKAKRIIDAKKNHLEKLKEVHLSGSVAERLAALVEAYEAGIDKELIEARCPGFLNAINLTLYFTTSTLFFGTTPEAITELKTYLLNLDKAKQQGHVLQFEALQLLATMQFSSFIDIEKIILCCELALICNYSLAGVVTSLTGLLQKVPAVAPIISALQRAIDLEKLPSGMTRRELFKTCLWLEQKREESIQKTKDEYRKREPLLLPRSVECVEGQIIIHLKQQGVKQLGRGYYKIVTPSLLYNVAPPQLVAQATSVPYEGILNDDKNIRAYENEMRFLKELNGLRGIVKTYCATKYTKEDGSPLRYSFVQKLYNGGTLQEQIDKLQIDKGSLTAGQRESVALYLLEGLHHIHERGILHLDLNSKQCLVDSSNGKVDAVIADFGRAVIPAERTDELYHRGIPWFTAYKDTQGKWYQTEVVASRREADFLRLKQSAEAEVAEEIDTVHFHFRDEVATMAMILSPLFFEKMIPPYSLESQLRREAFDEKSKAKQLFMRKEAVQYVLLKMMSWSEENALMAEGAFRTIKKILEIPATSFPVLISASEE
ncbi:MAG TPA: protein kinase, partial [Chlamydiales bacterium]|nr:protein kinase [Chlamydiales bacterium]